MKYLLATVIVAIGCALPQSVAAHPLRRPPLVVAYQPPPANVQYVWVQKRIGMFGWRRAWFLVPIQQPVAQSNCNCKN